MIIESEVCNMIIESEGCNISDEKEKINCPGCLNEILLEDLVATPTKAEDGSVIFIKKYCKYCAKKRKNIRVKHGK